MSLTIAKAQQMQDAVTAAQNVPLVGSATTAAATFTAKTQIFQELPQHLQDASYSSQIVDAVFDTVMNANLSSMTDDQLNTAVQNAVVDAVIPEIRTLSPSEQYDALRDLANDGDAANTTQLESFFQRMDTMPQGLQESLAHAYVNNASFRDYIGNEMGNNGGGFVDDLFDSMYQTRINANGDEVRVRADLDGDGTVGADEYVLDQNNVNAVQGILTSIGNDPNYDAPARLNPVRDAMAAHERAVQGGDPEEISAANIALIGAVRDAGANVPALAGVDGVVLMGFLNNLATQGADYAINDLAATLQLSGAELEAFQELIGPFAQFLDFMIEPYAELWMEHGNSLMAGFNSIKNNVNTLTNTQQPSIFQADVPATMGSVANFDQLFADRFNPAAGGGPIVVDVDYIFDKIVEVDPSLRDEIRGIQAAPDLREPFETMANGSLTEAQMEDKIAQWRSGLESGQTVREATMSLN